LPAVDPFTDEQGRALVNLEQRYQVWMEAERALRALPYDLRRKEVGGRFYLYEILDRSGNGKSLGPWSPDMATRHSAYRDEKARLKDRDRTSRATLDESGRLGRALRLPAIAEEAGAILREADRRGLLDGDTLVIGTSALPAYAVEAGGFIRGAPDETQDLDMAWASQEPDAETPRLWPMLKAVDPTFTVNMERGFQARTAKAFEVEVVVAPSRAATLPRLDQPHPIALPEQEWLLCGRPVDHIVITRSGAPARIVAPDPRWFALQKLWLSRQPKRSPLKRPKDRKQGLALLDAVAEAMPQYPLDEAFETALPDPLIEPYRSWRSGRNGAER